MPMDNQKKTETMQQALTEAMEVYNGKKMIQSLLENKERLHNRVLRKRNTDIHGWGAAPATSSPLALV